MITACDYNNWYVDVNVANHQDNAVEAYPNVHRDYNDRALSTIQSADFAGVGPSAPDASTTPRSTSGSVMVSATS